MPGPDKPLLLQKSELTKLEGICELKIRTDYFNDTDMMMVDTYFKANLVSEECSHLHKLFKDLYYIVRRVMSTH